MRSSRIILLPGLLVAVLAAAACSRKPAPTSGEAPHRIVALTSGAVDILAELGELDRVIGVEEDCVIPGLEGKARIRNDDHAGPARAIEVEAVLALRPDAVIAKPELRQALGGRGLRIVWTPERVGLKTIPAMVEDIGRLVGAPEKAKALLDRMNATMERIRKRVAGKPKVRVYFEDAGMGRSFGPDTVVGDMIELAGGSNIARDQPLAKPVLSAEAILAADPEVIVLSPWSETPEEIAKRPGWARITAVREGHVYRIPMDERTVMYFSPRCVDGCERVLVGWIHPEVAPEGETEPR
jgi:iron complex transport system substrate-binding protein